MRDKSLEDRVYGSLLGTVLADALGATFEGMEAETLRRRFGNPADALGYALQRESLRYTDDGQMTLVLAEYLTNNDVIDSQDLMREFVMAYESWRGYGRGARMVIEAFRDSAEYEHMVQHLFPGGSYGNGAAMRSAPVGLRYSGQTETIVEQAKRSAWPTHRHELGIDGAILIAQAASLALNDSEVSPASVAEALLSCCSTIVFEKRLKALREAKTPDDLDPLGNGIEAHESVVTALGCFAFYPDSFQDAIACAIWRGGDTDTIGAMVGALVGARVGSDVEAAMPLDRLEDGEPFLVYLRELAGRLASSVLLE